VELVSVAAVIPLSAGRYAVRVADLVARSEIDGETVGVPVETLLSALLLAHYTQQRAAVAVRSRYLLQETR